MFPAARQTILQSFRALLPRRSATAPYQYIIRSPQGLTAFARHLEDIPGILQTFPPSQRESVEVWDLDGNPLSR